MKELCDILDRQSDKQKVLLLYTDGGPDYRVTYTSVQKALVAIFIMQDLDFL